MAGRVVSKGLGGTPDVVDYAPNDADREWVQREIGDVPHTTLAERLAANGFPTLGVLVGLFDGVRMRD